MKVIALVVGIDHYEHTEFFAELKCAVHDADEVAKELANLKIDVTASLDDDEDKLLMCYDNFLDRINQESPQVAIFYFSGHGEIVNLQDSLILKNAYRSSKGETILLKHSLQVNQILNDMRTRGDQINILILDACRNKVRGALGVQEVNLKVPFQTFIAYSTSEGCSASDGIPGGHSPFTGAFLKWLPTENMKIEDLFKQVRKDMFASGRRQYSWDYSCLVDDFCFNHGQLNRHYGDKFAATSFAPKKLNLALVESGLFTGLVDSGIDKNVDSAMNNLVANKDKLNKDELFLLGRSMLEACKYPAVRRYINITKLSLLSQGGENYFFDGLLYEMFFDGQDECRKKEIKGVEILDDVARICDSKEFASSVSFIQKELELYKDEVSFVPGTDVQVVKLVVDSSEICDNIMKKVWVITDIDYKDESIYGLLDETAYTFPNLRKQLRDLLRVPFRNFRIKTSENLAFDDIILVSELGYVDDFIYDYYQNHTPNEFDELGHHYEFTDVEDSSIMDVEANDGLLIVKGSFSLSVIAYLDAEEEVRNNVALDGKFKMSLEYEDNRWQVVDYEDMKLNPEIF